MTRNVLRTRVVFGAVLAVALCLAPVLQGSMSAASAGRTAPCEPGDTELVIGQGGAGLGHWSITLLLVDPGARTCTFKGYPTVRALESTKRWIPALPTPSGYLGGLGSGQQIHTVTLTYDSVASMKIEGTDNPVGNATTCPSYVRIVVALPGWRPSANLSIDASACSRLEVHPLVVGPTGNQGPQ